jgi:hypothetical protein
MVNDYRRKLDQALAGLSPDVAKDVSAQVSEHIADALSATPNPSQSDVKKVLAEVGSPMSIARAASAEFPSAHRVSLRTLAFWAYTFWFGALWGFNPTSWGSQETGLLVVSYAMALVGSALIWMKNRRIGDRRLRSRIQLADLAVATVAIAIDWLMPASAGMLRGPVLMAIFLAYYYKTWSLYQAA